MQFIVVKLLYYCGMGHCILGVIAAEKKTTILSVLGEFNAQTNCKFYTYNMLN